ncbi:OmpA family protein [Myroides marinus]|uniref:OmpA family protein n=1 Tax=Myroides marinus TaxID=703342 RepID=UPI002576AEAF|nr:OmpA family protein [Myroides marinus]MDM1373730.1 OmpA family protein [Myroides marinus]MDM1378674.1 OmpA family protein [Myroides marinus]MDM1385945.1 OmpA family protein [Myroides marinus]MDM1393158.1 OmpA family protein [Myroides marinus]MDM1531739.1 OmpA family protein [Myroides marinus]
MKRVLICLTLAFAIYSCGSKEKQQESNEVVTTENETKTEENSSTPFDINTIPVTTQTVGVFPFLEAPENYCYGYCSNWKGKPNPSDIKNFDKQYFAVNGELIAIEGKTYNSTLEKNRQKDNAPFNSLEVEKSYEKAILALGGVKVNDQALTQETLDKINKEELLQSGSSIPPAGRKVNTYVIRTNDKEVWIQFNLLNEESGRITILEKSDLKTLEVATITADVMKAEIDKTGKSILHINFDTDKATLKPDGKQVADQILQLLQNNPSLKLSIEGHTDNTGNADHNKKLSLDRANTLVSYLTINGIDASRLKAQGLGADKPLNPNDSETNKAKNRRVELVKL